MRGRQPDTDRVGEARNNQGIGCGQTIEQRGCVLRCLLRCEAEAACDCRIDLEVGCRTRKCVVDPVLCIDDAGDRSDRGLDPGSESRQERGIAREEFDLNRLGRVRQVVDHIL